MELKMLITTRAPLGHKNHCLPVPVGSHPRLHALTSSEVLNQLYDKTVRLKMVSAAMPVGHRH